MFRKFPFKHVIERNRQISFATEMTLLAQKKYSISCATPIVVDNTELLCKELSMGLSCYENNSDHSFMSDLYHTTYMYKLACPFWRNYPYKVFAYTVIINQSWFVLTLAKEKNTISMKIWKVKIRVLAVWNSHRGWRSQAAHVCEQESYGVIRTP